MNTVSRILTATALLLSTAPAFTHDTIHKFTPPTTVQGCKNFYPASERGGMARAQCINGVLEAQGKPIKCLHKCGDEEPVAQEPDCLNIEGVDSFYCVNQQRFCDRSRFDVASCSEIQFMKAQQEIYIHMQRCKAMAVDKVNADRCNSGFNECTRNYYTGISVPLSNRQREEADANHWHCIGMADSGKYWKSVGFAE